MKKNDLNLFEASSVIAGLGIGGGIMAVPYLASLSGLVPIVLILVLAYGFSVLLHLMITEMVMRDHGELQLVETFGKFLFRGKMGGFLTWFFFAVVTLNFYALLTAYIVGAGDIIVNLTGVSPWAARLMAYICAAGPIFFGLKALGISEKFGVIGIVVLVAVMILGSLSAPFHRISLFSFSAKGALALYGMVMFAFSCFFSVPQAVKVLHRNKKMVPYAVMIGIGINFILVLSITITTLLVSGEITEMAIIGWGNAVGQWAVRLGGGFVFLAILTSYWGVSYALAVVIEERLHWNYRSCWLAATLPTLFLALLGITGFLGFMRIAGGLLAILISIMVIPAFRSSRRYGSVRHPEFQLGWSAHPVFQGLVIVAYVLVVAGSVVSVP